jgi:hypothetical protein
LATIIKGQRGLKSKQTKRTVGKGKEVLRAKEKEENPHQLSFSEKC